MYGCCDFLIFIFDVVFVYDFVVVVGVCNWEVL